MVLMASKFPGTTHWETNPPAPPAWNMKLKATGMFLKPDLHFMEGDIDIVGVVQGDHRRENEIHNDNHKLSHAAPAKKFG